jgi:hypothetical protein
VSNSAQHALHKPYVAQTTRIAPNVDRLRHVTSGDHIEEPPHARSMI